MILLIDQGNSNIKWCLCKNGNLQPVYNGSLTVLKEYLKIHGSSISEVLISSVKNEQQLESLTYLLKEIVLVPIQVANSGIEHQALKNGYKNYTQLGIDRWLAMIAAWADLQSGFIIVDAGSALTLDIVDASGKHQGGHIIPGLSMQKKSLLAQAERVNFEEDTDSSVYCLGTSTSEAVHNGCLSNLCGYITLMYQQQINNNTVLPLFLTGGDAGILSKGLEVEHQVIPDLVLRGLYYFFYNTVP